MAVFQELLFVLMTGEAWTDVMAEIIKEHPDDSFVVVAYFLTYLFIQYFVIVNLFVMVRRLK